MRITTWNINSLRLRLPLLANLVAAQRPDVICLQETKVPDDLFPSDAMTGLGYPYYLRAGMKSYNGVAIFSRLPLTRVPSPDWCGREDCRHLLARVGEGAQAFDLHNFYVPAGGDVADRTVNEKFGHKLDFLTEVTAWFAARKNLTRSVVVGDLNIAPGEHDVWSHKQLVDVVSHTPIEVEKLGAWMKTGFYDAVRHFVPAQQKLYTWWSYRNRDWSVSDRGRRLDHVWVTEDLVPGLRKYAILREARDWTQPSDHVPVMVELDLHLRSS